MEILYYCINLPDSIDRRRSMEKQAKKHNIKLEIVKAVDGKTDEINDFEFTEKRGRMNWADQKLTGPEIGCILSHRKALETFLKTKANYCVVLEDDAVIGNNFNDKLKEIADYKYWDLVKIENRHGNKKRGITMHELKSGEKIVAGYKCDIGTTGLFYTRKGAEKIISTLHSLILPIDVHLAHYRCWKVDILEIVPPIVTHAEFNSVLNTGINRIPSRKVKRNISNNIGKAMWSIFRHTKAIKLWALTKIKSTTSP